MKEKYFKNISTKEELRKRYKELLKRYHPDNKDGDLGKTKEINEEYAYILKSINEKEGNTNNEGDIEFEEILRQIITYDITIEIIGEWIWCFDCYKYKRNLKEIGFKWCSKKKAWVWHSSCYKRRGYKDIGIEKIRKKYGSRVVRKQSNITPPIKLIS